MSDDLDGWDDIPDDAADTLASHVSRDAWIAALTPLLVAAGLSGAEASTIGQQLGTSKWSAEIETALSDRTGKITGDITKTTEDLIQQAVDYARVNGGDIDSLREAIQGVFDVSDSRAQMIAVTESVGSANAGSAEMAARADDAGYTVTGTWHHAGEDEKEPREDHLAADGETTTWGEPFSMGLMYPHDEAGDADMVIGCQCEADWEATGPNGETIAIDTGGDEGD